MLSNFVGRHKELGLLDELWDAPRASLLILYGRRRVGKTRLLTHWLKERQGRGMYWVAEPTSAYDQLRSFSQALYNYATPDDPAPLDFTYANWDQALRQVALLANMDKMALFIDELGYLLEVNPAFAGTLQKAWDHWLSKSNMILALSGSQSGLIQNLFNYDAPLYGRATAQVNLPPLPYSATSQFFPQYNTPDRVKLYSIWGGIPAYWERLDAHLSINDNIRRQLLSANTLMQEEPRLLLQDFINDPHNYVGIMRAIAGGSVTNSRISTRTGLPKGHISKYLNVLRESGFVVREVPVTEDPSKSRRGRYHINDPYLRFHYRFLSAYQSKLALGEQQQMLDYITVNLPAFIEANTWTDLCREWLLRASVHSDISLQLEMVGGAWSRNVSLPVVGIHQAQKHLVFANCQWRLQPATLTSVEDLVRKAAQLVPKADAAEWKVSYVCFSAGGWMADAMESASAVVNNLSHKHAWQTYGVQLIGLPRVDADLARWTLQAQAS